MSASIRRVYFNSQFHVVHIIHWEWCSSWLLQFQYVLISNKKWPIQQKFIYKYHIKTGFRFGLEASAEQTKKKLCTFLLFIWKVHLIGSFQNQHIVVVPSHFEFILFDFVLINTQFLFNYVSVMYGLVFGWRNHAEGLWTYVEALYSSKWILRTNVIHSSERQAKKNVLAVLSCVCVSFSNWACFQLFNWIEHASITILLNKKSSKFIWIYSYHYSLCIFARFE